MPSGTGMRTLGVFAAIFDDAGRILCANQLRGEELVDSRWARGVWRIAARGAEASGLEIEPGELLWVYAKPEENDLVLSFRASVVGRTPWRPTDEIAELGYFGPEELPESISVAARTRIHDAFEGKSGVFRVIEAVR